MRRYVRHLPSKKHAVVPCFQHMWFFLCGWFGVQNVLGAPDVDTPWTTALFWSCSTRIRLHHVRFMCSMGMLFRSRRSPEILPQWHVFFLSGHGERLELVQTFFPHCSNGLDTLYGSIMKYQRRWICSGSVERLWWVGARYGISQWDAASDLKSFWRI